MMHYDSWVHSQNVLQDNHRCFTTQYIEESYRTRNDNRDEESEQTGDETHDTMTSATSGERSSSADIFRLEFAATQWSKLVSNAEGLFSKLVASDVLPHNEQDQIKQWLCMKQEYEECITSDDTASLPGFTENPRRSLEIIEEVTETDEKTDESGNHFRNITNSRSSSEDEMSEEDDEEDQSDASSSENPDFLEKLDECMNKLKRQTDRLIDSIDDGFQEKGLAIIPAGAHPVNNNIDRVPIVKPIPIRNQNSRRNSMMPGSEMCKEVMAFSGGFRPCQKKFENDNAIDNFRESNIRNGNGGQKNDSSDMLKVALRSNEISEEIRTLKALAINNEVKQTQVKKIQSDLDGAHKRIDELQTTIKIKEKFIADMIKNSDARSSAKQKFQRKRSRLEEEYYTTRTQLAQAENSLYRDNEKTTHKREIELYKNIAIHYEKRLLDIEMIKQIADDSAKKVLELEGSLNSSKKQMEKLKKQLNKEEERKTQLEDELAVDQKKIRELEEKYNLTASKLKEMQSESEDERSNTKSRQEQDKKKNLLEMSARISHLDHVLKEKSMHLERTADIDGKEALRLEIRRLRDTRDCLVEEKCDLDEKLQKERTLTIVEERKRLECGETIEAIDVIIEHKNEKICGKKRFDENQSKREDIECLLMERLSMLSLDEMVKLFLEYFYKVIDLKESSKLLDIQLAEVEVRVQEQEWNNQTLRNTLKQAKLEAERRIVVMQKQHEESLHLMFRHFADETGSSSHERLDKDSELVKYKRENKTLRRRLADLEALVRGQIIPTATSPPRIPQQELKQITSPTTRPTTKVTLKKNKLIIQKTDCDKKKK